MSVFYVVRYKEGARLFFDEPGGLASEPFDRAHKFASKKDAIREAQARKEWLDVFEVTYGVTWDVEGGSPNGKDYFSEQGVPFMGGFRARKGRGVPKRFSREEAWSKCKEIRRVFGPPNVFKVVRFMRKVKA